MCRNAKAFGFYIYVLLNFVLLVGRVGASQFSLNRAVSLDVALENTAICSYSEETHALCYDRVRADLALQHSNYPFLLAKLVLDNETLYIDRVDDWHNRSSIYRGYLQSSGTKHLWSVGKQRIPLGVGRIWNPIDIFNPIDTEQIEPEQRAGTESIRYEYALSALANMDSTIAKDKGALRIKGYLENADVALVGLWDGDGGQDIIGWEIEGQLLDTGLELRTEGGSFSDHDSGERSTQFIVGAEYGFASSLNVLAEYKFSDNTSSDYLAFQVSCQPQTLYFWRILMIANLEDASYFVSPSIDYSLSDEMTISVGAFVYAREGGEFSACGDHYYMNWFLKF